MTSKATRWTPLEHKIYQQLKSDKVSSGTALIAVSGGLDSMLLLRTLQHLADSLRLRLAVVHVHHGGVDSFRREAQDLVKRWCAENEILFFTETSKEFLSSENEARNYRIQIYAKAKKHFQAEWLFLGHHADDLLETRLLRLLRGTGPQGLKAMKTKYQDRVRPFLITSKVELQKEARLQSSKENLVWVEDPTNQESLFLRNWLRNEWLPSLEKRSPGAAKVFARSLELLLESHESLAALPATSLKNGISKAKFLSLTESQKKTCLARYISSLKIRNLTQNHIKEVLKHLDNSKNHHTFTVAQLNWTLTKDRIIAVRRAI